MFFNLSEFPDINDENTWKMHCQSCGKKIPYGNMIQRMGCFCDDCAGYKKGKTLCQCCVNGSKDCLSKGSWWEPCGYTPHYKFR